MQDIIDNIKAQGLQVFGPEKLTTYAYFTDGTRIGYVQSARVGGISYSTVHKPSSECGTGFKVDNVQEALGRSPSWGGGSRDFVVKFRDFAEFQKKHWQPLVQY